MLRVEAEPHDDFNYHCLLIALADEDYLTAAKIRDAHFWEIQSRYHGEMERRRLDSLHLEIDAFRAAGSPADWAAIRLEYLSVAGVLPYEVYGHRSPFVT